MTVAHSTGPQFAVERRWWTVAVAASLTAAAWIRFPDLVLAPIGLVVVNFVPGWLLVELLFSPGTFAIVERVLLSVVLSLAVPALVTFSLFYWIRFDAPTLKVTTSAVIVVELLALSLQTWIRQRRLRDQTPRAADERGHAATS